MTSQTSASQHSAGQLSSLSPALKDILAGTSAGVANILVCHPLDTIRVRMQTTDAQRFTSISDLVRQTYTKEGVKGFYKGIGAPIASQGLHKAMMFYSFGTIKRFVEQRRADKEHPSPTLRPYELFVCGGLAGGFTAIVVSPVELVRNNLQVQYQRNIKDARFTGPIHCAATIIREHGLLSMWRGVTPMVARDLPAVGMWFATFNYMSQHLQHNVLPTPANQPIEVWKLAAAGACAGIGYWTFGFAQDSVKSVMQTKAYNAIAGSPSTAIAAPAEGFIATAQQLIAEAGVKRLYRGFSSALLRGMVGASTTFTTYNLVLRYINEH